MFIDTHAHLSFPDFAADLPATVARAAVAGVTRIVSVATDLADARRVLSLPSDADYLAAFRTEFERAVRTAMERGRGQVGILLSEIGRAHV